MLVKKWNHRRETEEMKYYVIKLKPQLGKN